MIELSANKRICDHQFTDWSAVRSSPVYLTTTKTKWT